MDFAGTEIVQYAQWPGPQWANRGFLYRNPTDGREKWSWQFDSPDGNGATTYAFDTDPWSDAPSLIVVRTIKRDRD